MGEKGSHIILVGAGGGERISHSGCAIAFDLTAVSNSVVVVVVGEGSHNINLLR